jgi:hypothetical protein
MLRVGFSVSNRFGEPLPRAEVTMWGTAVPQDSGVTAIADESGMGDVLVHGGSVGKSASRFRILWTSEDGVVWGMLVPVTVDIVRSQTGGDLMTRTRIGFSVTMRMVPQALPAPEINHLTRRRLLASVQGKQVHLAYEEARDCLIAGLPNASATMSGRALETAFLSYGSDLGWPVQVWAEKQYTLGAYIEEPALRTEVQTTLGGAFYRRLKAANVTRVVGTHQTGGGLHMDDARQLLRLTTQLIDGWFGKAP